MTTGRAFQTWARTHRVVPRSWHEPRDEDEVRAIVRRVGAERGRLRVVGAGHSWTDIACGGDHLLSLDRAVAPIRLDRARMRVTVSGGARLHALVDTLASFGLALHNLGSIAEQTIAGATATATHGTGARFGNLSTQIVGMRLVSGAGETCVIDDERSPGLLEAARVSLGCLGVVTELTLSVCDAYDLEEKAWSLPFDEAVRALPGLVAAHDHLKYWWLPHTGRVQVFAYDRCGPRGAPGAGWARAGDELVNRWLFAGLLRLGGRLPRVVPALNKLVGRGYFRERERVDRGDRLLNVSMPPRHLELEYAIPAEAAGEAMRAVRDRIQRRRLSVGFPQEIRFVAADHAPMSPDFGRASCRFGAYIGASPHAAGYLDEVERLLIALDGRPHWGKLFTLRGASLRARFPQAERFLAIRRQLDPADVFVNPFIQRLLS